MINEALVQSICIMLLNYILISSAAILSVLLLSRSGLLKSYLLQDRLWKAAMIGPVVISLAQVFLPVPLVNWNLATLVERESIVDFEAAAVAAMNDNLPELLEFSETPIEPIVDEANKPPEFEVRTEEMQNLVSTPITNLVPIREIDTSVAGTELDPSPTLVEENPVALASPDDVSTVQQQDEIFGKVASTSAIPTRTPRPPNADSTLEYAQILNITALTLLVLSTCGGVLMLVQVARLKFFLRKCCVSSKAGLKRTVEQEQQRLGIRRSIRILECAQVTEPAACGVFIWSIVVPENLELAEDELSALIAHELAHLLRRDPLWACCLYGLRILACWQPLNWVAYRRWRLIAEQCSDQLAVAAGVDRFALARCLTEFARKKQLQAPAFGVGASSSSLSQRVVNLVDSDRPMDRWHDGWRRRMLIVVPFYSIVPCLLALPKLSWTIEHDVSPSSANRGFASIAGVDRVDQPFDPVMSDSQSIPTEVPFDSSLPQMQPESIVESIPVTDRQPTEAELAKSLAEVTADLDVALSLIAERRDSPEFQRLIDELKQRNTQLELAVKNTQLLDLVNAESTQPSSPTLSNQGEVK